MTARSTSYDSSSSSSAACRLRSWSPGRWLQVVTSDLGFGKSEMRQRLQFPFLYQLNNWTIATSSKLLNTWSAGRSKCQLSHSGGRHIITYLLQEYPMPLPQSKSLLRHLYPLQLGSSSPEKDFSGRRIMGEQKGWGHLLRNAISGARRAPCKRRLQQQDTTNYSKSRTHLQMLPQSQPNDVLWSPIHSNKENGQHSDVHYQTGVYCNPSFLYLGIV